MSGSDIRKIMNLMESSDDLIESTELTENSEFQERVLKPLVQIDNSLNNILHTTKEISGSLDIVIQNLEKRLQQLRAENAKRKAGRNV